MKLVIEPDMERFVPDTGVMHVRAMAKVAAVFAVLDEKVIRHVRDAVYWGRPVGTIIEPGMRPQHFEGNQGVLADMPLSSAVQVPVESDADRIANRQPSLVAQAREGAQRIDDLLQSFWEHDDMDASAELYDKFGVEADEYAYDGQSPLVISGDWLFFGACRDIREAAYDLLGYRMDEEEDLYDATRADPNVRMQYDPGWGGGSRSARAPYPMAYAIMRELHYAPPSSVPMWRGTGLYNYDATSFTEDNPVGSVFDLPVASFVGNEGAARRFGDGLIIRVQKGARAIGGGFMGRSSRQQNALANMFGAPNDDDADADIAAYDEYEGDPELSELVTGGRFKVTNITQDENDTWIVSVKQIATFDPDTGMATKMANHRWTYAGLFDDSVRADMTRGESKDIRRVRDAAYWGRPRGTPITPGMKPVRDRIPVRVLARPRVVSMAQEPPTNKEWLEIARKFPNLNHYRDGGMGGVGPDRSVVGMVSTTVLAAMPGNGLRKSDILRPFDPTKMTDPIQIEFDPDNGRMFVGEGNHRVESALAAGVNELPARMIRSWISDDKVKRVESAEQGGRVAQIVMPPSPWKQRTGTGEKDYWPSDVHPSYLLGTADKPRVDAAKEPPLPDVYFDRHERMWAAVLHDDEGNAIPDENTGDTAMYFPSKVEATEHARRRRMEMGAASVEPTITSAWVHYGDPHVMVEPYRTTDKRGFEVEVSTFWRDSNGSMPIALGHKVKKDGETASQQITLLVTIPKNVADELGRLLREKNVSAAMEPNAPAAPDPTDHEAMRRFAIAEDKKSAELYAQEQPLLQKRALLLNDMHRVAGHKKNYGQQARYEPWTGTAQEALDGTRAAAANQSLPAHVREGAQKTLDRHDANEAEIKKLNERMTAQEATYRKYGWSRAFLAVTNGDGHVHSSMHCPTCNRGKDPTQFAWMTDYSGSDESEIVDAAGVRACTVCYPSAPVESLNKPTRMFSPDEIDKAKAREEREAAKIARDAKKVNDAATADGSELRVDAGRGWTERFKTERSALIWANDNYYNFYEEHDENGVYPPGAREGVRQVAEAIAEKRGVPVDEVMAEIIAKADAKAKKNVKERAKWRAANPHLSPAMEPPRKLTPAQRDMMIELVDDWSGETAKLESSRRKAIESLAEMGYVKIEKDSWEKYPNGRVVRYLMVRATPKGHAYVHPEDTGTKSMPVPTGTWLR